MCAHDLPLARLPHAASQCEIVEDGERISVAIDSRQPGRHTVHLLARDLDGLPLNHPEQGFSVNASRPEDPSYAMPEDSMSIVYAGSDQYDVTIDVHGVPTPRSHSPCPLPVPLLLLSPRVLPWRGAHACLTRARSPRSFAQSSAALSSPCTSIMSAFQATSHSSACAWLASFGRAVRRLSARIARLIAQNAPSVQRSTPSASVPTIGVSPRLLST